MPAEPAVPGSRELRTAVFEALGAASVCWATPEGAGEFDSRRAEDIGEGLMAEIIRLTRDPAPVLAASDRVIVARDDLDAVLNILDLVGAADGTEARARLSAAVEAGP